MSTNNNSYIFEPHPIGEVELLGYAKNNIVEVEEMVSGLPYDCWVMLSRAFELLDQVQEYLYTH